MVGKNISDFRFPIADLRIVLSQGQIGNRQWAIGNSKKEGMIKNT